MEWDTAATPQTLRFDRTRLTDPPDDAAAVAACFGLSLAPLFEGAEQGTGMRRAFDYVLGQAHRRKLFQDIERKFTFVRRGGESALPERSRLLDQLVESVLHSREVAVTYRHFDGSAEDISVRPLSVCIYDHQLYVVGQKRDGARRLLRLSRIEAMLDAQGATFEYPAKTEYDPRQLFADSFGVFIDDRIPVVDVEVKLDSRWTTHARSHRWHSTQKVEVLSSGEVLVRLRVRVCPEVEAWVLGFGEQAEVLKPAALRARVVARLRVAATRYQADDDGQCG